MSQSSGMRAEQILSDVLDLPAADRPAAVAAACGGDAELRGRVQTLLGANAGDVPAEPARGGTADEATVGPDGDDVPVAEGPGIRIGRYKLLQQIGEGGFGVVFLAEQEYPVRRRVAVKVIKLGMDTREVVARFEAERQALALMDHPNIARVLDAGSTGTGRPYFVMELVRGCPITEYADRHRLDTAARVALLAEVCRAVQHAHQKGVIHRDLKPTNVLVATADDGRPVPKVIDFGIAKATQGKLTDRTLFTAHRQLIGTPQYMSPEQADSDGTDVDTRTDVYSLGVVLYELLVGTTPFDAGQLRSAESEAMRRMIREVEPPRPSTRAGRLSETTTAIAAARQTDPKRLGQAVRGELDWIVMRALEKDRRRRYESPLALADDLARHLGGDPVEAGPVSGWYRARKLAGRHRRLLATATVIVGALLLGVVGTSVGLVREARQRRVADAQRSLAQGRQREADAARAEADRQRAAAEGERDEARAAVGYLTHDVLDAAVRQQPHDVAARQVLAGVLTRPAVLDVDARFPGHPLEAATVREALAWSLNAVGQDGPAVAQAGAALATRRRLLGDDDRDTIRAQVLTAYLHKRGPADGLSMSQDAYDRARRLYGDRDPVTLWAEFTYACSLNWAGRSAEALPLIRQAYEGQQAVLGPDQWYTLTSLEAYGAITEYAGHPADAVTLTGQAFDRSQRALGPDASATIWALAAVGNALAAAGRPAEAADRYADVVARMTRWLGPDDANTLFYTDHLLGALMATGDWAGAASVDEPLLAAARRRGDAAATARYGDDLETFRLAQALAATRPTTGPGGAAAYRDDVAALNRHATAAVAAGRYAAAEAVYRVLVDLSRREMPVAPDHVADALDGLGHALERLGPGRAGEARDTLAAAAAVRSTGRADPGRPPTRSPPR